MLKIILDENLEPTKNCLEEVNLIGDKCTNQYYESEKIIHRSLPNSLIDMLHYAWANHLPVKIRPDDLWLQILCQFALYVNNNSEKYQHLFADKDNLDGQTQLVVDMTQYNNIRDVPMEKFIAQIMDQLESKIASNDAVSKLQCDFSTSNNITKLVSNIAFMYAVEKYFSYKMILSCGIPWIELDGTLEDWKNFQLKIQYLCTIADDNIKSWCQNLEDISVRILNSISNVEDGKQFWKHLFYEDRCGSGSQTCAKGWITNLFIYDKSMKMFEQEYYPLGKERKSMYDSGVTMFWDDFPECLIKCPIQVSYGGECNSTTYEISAGMFGFNSSNRELSPLCLVSGFNVKLLEIIGWTFDSKVIRQDAIKFTKENYDRIKYNNKYIHEWFPYERLTEKHQDEYNCDNIQIYYNAGMIKYVFLDKSGQKNRNNVMSCLCLESFLANGKLNNVKGYISGFYSTYTEHIAKYASQIY